MGEGRVRGRGMERGRGRVRGRGMGRGRVRGRGMGGRVRGRGMGRGGWTLYSWWVVFSAGGKKEVKESSKRLSRTR